MRPRCATQWVFFGVFLLTPCVTSGFSLTEVTQLSAASYRLVFGDTDHDGRNEVFFTWRDGAFNFSYRILEEQGNNVYTQEYLGAPSYPLAIGDLDGDGRSDLVAQWSSQLQVYESTSAADYPTQLVWSYPVPNILVPAAIADTDRDGKMEIVYFRRTGGFSTQLTIFEAAGDNMYNLVYSLPTHDSGAPIIGDLDGDGLSEIAFCGYSTPGLLASALTVVESPADNTWATTFTDSAGLKVGGEGQGGRDTDGNGKPELFFSGLTATGFRAAVIYEPCGDNSFQRVATIAFDDGSSGNVLSALGNIDGAGPEEYLLEGHPIHVYRPVAPGQWILVGQITDPSPSGIHNYPSLFDANKNGLPELFWPSSASEAESTLVLEQVDVPTSTHITQSPPGPVLQVIPNPCRNGATLFAPGVLLDTASVSLYDVAGRLVERRPPVQDSGGRFLWVPRPIAPGIYFLGLEDKHRTPVATGRVTVIR